MVKRYFGAGWVGVDPGDGFGLLDRLDVEVHRDRLAVGAHQHAFERLVLRRVDLLVRHVGRHVDEVARPRLGDELQLVAPAHAGLALEHIDDAFEVPVVVRAGLGVGVDRHRARPDFFRADAGEVDRRLAVHARSLRGVGIERARGDHPHAVVLPVTGCLGLRLAHVASVRGCHCGNDPIPDEPISRNPMAPKDGLAGPKNGRTFVGSTALCFTLRNHDRAVPVRLREDGDPGPGRRFLLGVRRDQPPSLSPTFSKKPLPVSIDAPSCFTRPSSSDDPQRSTILPFS